MPKVTVTDLQELARAAARLFDHDSLCELLYGIRAISEYKGYGKVIIEISPEGVIGVDHLRTWRPRRKDRTNETGE